MDLALRFEAVRARIAIEFFLDDFIEISL